MLDFNRTVMKALAANEAINALVDATAREDAPRPYLGASAIGHDCLREIQWDWRQPAGFPARTMRIFDRGRWFEGYAAQALASAGFRMVRDGERLAFSQMDGLFRGHADGLVIAGPDIAGLEYPCLWEAKGLGARGWTKLSKDGLAKAYPGYADQVALYQAYLDLADTPALFTAGNLDTMEMLHLLVPFDAARAQAASDRAVTVIRADLAGETLPRVAADSDDWRCKMCSHRARCWAE